MTKLWIDDLRHPPDHTWIWVKTSQEAIDVLQSQHVDHISFDHDLGYDANGEDDKAVFVATYIEELAAENAIHRISWEVHSANPVGRKDLTAIMESCERFWDRNGTADC